MGTVACRVKAEMSAYARGCFPHLARVNRHVRGLICIPALELAYPP